MYLERVVYDLVRAFCALTSCHVAVVVFERGVVAEESVEPTH